jgi:hypothetical protein
MSHLSAPIWFRPIRDHESDTPIIQTPMRSGPLQRTLASFASSESSQCLGVSLPSNTFLSDTAPPVTNSVERPDVRIALLPSMILSPIRQSPPHCLRRFRSIEFLWVEVTSPLNEVFVLLMIGVGQGFEELGVSPNASDGQFLSPSMHRGYRCPDSARRQPSKMTSCRQLSPKSY